MPVFRLFRFFYFYYRLGFSDFGLITSNLIAFYSQQNDIRTNFFNIAPITTGRNLQVEDKIIQDMIVVIC